jgi:hypothetical protein
VPGSLRGAGVPYAPGGCTRLDRVENNGRKNCPSTQCRDRARVMMRLIQFETMIATTIARTTTCRATKSREGKSRRAIKRTGRNANIPRPSKRRRGDWRERSDTASRRDCEVVRRPGTSLLHGGECMDSPHIARPDRRLISVLAMQLSARSFYSTPSIGRGLNVAWATARCGCAN